VDQAVDGDGAGAQLRGAGEGIELGLGDAVETARAASR
jgi:hypothetical protein